MPSRGFVFAALIPPKRFDIFPPDWGMLRRSRRVLIFLLNCTERPLDLTDTRLVSRLFLTVSTYEYVEIEQSPSTDGDTSCLIGLQQSTATTR